MENCDDPECLICYPLVTKTGRVITVEELTRWADQAQEEG